MKEEIMQALIAGEEVASEDVLEYINDLKEQVRKETAKEIRESRVLGYRKCILLCDEVEC